MAKKPNDDTGILDYIKEKMMGGGMADRTAKKVAERPDKVQEAVDRAMGVTPDVTSKRK